ncbi:MAG TPA: glycosyltransferase [Gammaproteobacteria bacterium]|nr:glycosyltransferase [Gammaproteobacteria bacterium]
MCDPGQLPDLADVDPAPELSFIIPALNEADNIVRTLASIEREAAAYRHEVIVVDNGSTDATAQLAQEAGAKVLLLPAGTIAAVRNHGVRYARGRVLVFLDADASLTSDWREHLPASLIALAATKPLVTGSHCSPPDHCSWIEHHWFREFAVEQNARHLGTGHMLIPRDFFLQMGGFDERLETGEDYEFCQRARAAGGEIVNNPQLRVVHHNFPRTLRQFIRREAWHGRGDLRSLRAFLQSKVALGASAFLVAHGLVLAGLLLPGVASLLPLGLLLLILLLAASTWKKYRYAPWRSRFVNGGLFYAYYLGRSASLLYLFQRRSARAPRLA